MVKIKKLIKTRESKWEVGTTIYNEGYLYMVIQTVTGKYTLINLETGANHINLYDSVAELQYWNSKHNDVIVDCNISLIKRERC